MYVLLRHSPTCSKLILMQNVNIDLYFQVPDKSHASTTDNKSSSFVTDLGFIHAFVASISVILVSELGDKTFFIAAIMAMRHPRLVVFTGAMAALGLMTVLSG